MSIYKDGDQFTIYGERRPYRMRSSFCLLSYYLSKNYDKGRAWLDRIKDIGFDGPRLFGENQQWFANGRSPFYGSEWTPLVLAVSDFNKPGSQLDFVPGYEHAVAMLGEDLRARRMVAEFSCVATIKELDQLVTGHLLNKWAQLFARLYPNPEDSPFLYETINEWDGGGAQYEDIDEVERYGVRWRRKSDDPEKRNYPNSLIGISAGGQWAPGLDDLGYTHRNLHCPRNPAWGYDGGRTAVESVGAALKEILRTNQGRPLALNETIHCMTQVEWDYWVVSGKISKWAGLSTTDVGRHVNYMKAVLDAGVSICAHDLVGQETNPGAELTVFEQEWKKLLNPNAGPPPPPPPPPPPEGVKMKLIAKHRLGSTVAYKLERAPEFVEGGSEEKVLRGSFRLVLDRPSYVKKVQVFHGTDRGDIVEMDTEIYGDPGGLPIFLRSDHKEMPTLFDAWKTSEVFPGDVFSQLHVGFLCRTNGANYYADELKSRPHWGIWITVGEVK